jgi:hypothetical protein
MPYASDPNDLFVQQNTTAYKYSGPCKYHKFYFGTELTLERNVPAYRGYSCEDCKRKRRAVREELYTRKDGTPLRPGTRAPRAVYAAENNKIDDGNV